MYLTLTDIQNGEPVSVPGTACMGLEVALCELKYYHRWLNISAELEDGIFDGRTVLGIPKGYYNVCELDKEAFRALGAELSLHAPTGRLQFPKKKRLVLNRGLADLLGLSLEFFLARPEPRCRQASSSDHPSGDLRASCRGQYVGEPPQRSALLTAEIHPRRERKVRGYKRLASGRLSQLTLTVLDTGGRKLGFDYLSAVLHIRRNG